MLVRVEAVVPGAAVGPEPALLLGHVEERHAVQRVRREDGRGRLAVVLGDVALLVAGDEGGRPPLSVERVDAVVPAPAGPVAVVAGDAVGRAALVGLVLACGEGGVEARREGEDSGYSGGAGGG